MNGGERQPERVATDENGLETRGVFENPDALKPSYTPSELQHRDEQVEKTASVLVSALRSETPSNILMYGRKGTGKTAAARYVGRELESAGRRFDVDCDVEYIDCVEVDTRYRVLTRLARRLGRDDVPEIGWPTDRVYDALVDGVESHGSVVVVLDEVDRLVEKSGDRALYSLSRMNRDLDGARVSLICVSDDAGFTETVDPRVRSSLGEETVYFPPYTAEQLRDILRRRVETAFVNGMVSDEVVPACAAFAAREGGDAGYAVVLLRAAGEIARSEMRTVTREDVRIARDDLSPRKQGRCINQELHER